MKQRLLLSNSLSINRFSLRILPLLFFFRLPSFTNFGKSIYLIDNGLIKIFQRWILLYRVMLLVGIFLFLFFNSFSQNRLLPSPKNLNSRISLSSPKNIGDREDLLKSFAINNGLSYILSDDDGAILFDIDERGQAIFMELHETRSGRVVKADRVYPNEALGLKLTGKGHVVAVVDAGVAYLEHPEFEGRVIQKNSLDQFMPISDHATHVSGIIGASGLNPEARGIAYEANIESYSFNNWGENIIEIAENDIPISNNSYGIAAGWRYDPSYKYNWRWFGDTTIHENADWKFGFYSSWSRYHDEFVYVYPYHLLVTSAGNSRNNLGPSSAPFEHEISINGEWVRSTTQRNQNGPYDSTPPSSTAKNILSVGAVDAYNPDDFSMSSFSSWGPTDDGRIKPDIVGVGVNVFSTVSGSENQSSLYGFKSGTSMASPNVTGGLVLIRQHFLETLNYIPLASTLKALAIHGARQHPDLPVGPNYRTGWGLLDVERAINQISKLDSNSYLIEEIILTSLDTVRRNLNSDGIDPIEVVIAWTDLPGTSPKVAVNPKDKMLINDLDLLLIDPNGVKHLPFILDPSEPSKTAQRGVNWVDNVEKVYIENPVKGEYLIRIVHKKGVLEGDQQIFSLVANAGSLNSNSVKSNFYLAENGITCMCPDAEIGESGTLVIDGQEKTFTKRAREQITPENAASTCTSGITDMHRLFTGKEAFNEDLSTWDVSSVTDMHLIFGSSGFNQPLEHWDVSKVTNMSYMFNDTPFNQPLEDWDVSRVTNMSYMFNNTPFDKPIGSWNISNVTNLEAMLSGTNFNHPLRNWNVSNVTNMNGLFSYSKFNQPIENWDVSNVIEMISMFQNSIFDQPIGNWDVSNVTIMASMFSRSEFNQPIGNWDVSSVTKMNSMFSGNPSFNQPIESWDVSNVKSMQDMFLGNTTFDQPIEKWDVSNVTNMQAMFAESSYNHSLANWDVSQVTNMSSMFDGAINFNKNISTWCVTNISFEPTRFSANSPLSAENKPIWGTCPASEPLPNPPSVDTTPPFLEAFNFTSTYIESSLSEYLINFQISDDSFLDTVMIFYKPIRSENRVNWQSTVNAALGNSIVVGGAFDLPNSAFDEIGTIFYLRAVDSNDNVLNTDTMYVYRAYDSNDPLSFQTPSFGVSANDFFIFGVPLMLDPNTVEEVIAPNFRGFNTRRWRMFYADGAQNIEASPSTPIQTGDGYWMISANPRRLNFSGTVPNVRVDSTFNFTLSPGWNLISNPYPFPMSWNAVLASNNNTQSVRTPLGFEGTYVEKATLQKFEGAYIFALEATTLSIPVGNSDNNRQEDLIFKPVFAGKNWSVNFDLNNESGNKFQLAGLGMHEEAQEGFDSFDMPLVPRMPNYVDLHFTEKSILGLPLMKDMVSQHEAYSWNMEVRSSKLNEKVSINWSTQNPQKGMGLLLVDLETGTRIDMLKTNEYSFTFNGPRNFTVEYVKVTSNEPTSSIFNPFLALPYPNPTQTEVNIPYSLPVGVHQYSLKILDMSGREVALLEEGQKEEGHYLANYNMDALPQGVYLIVLELPNNANSRMTRKLMVK